MRYAITVGLLIIGLFGFSQTDTTVRPGVYQSMPQNGYGPVKRMQIDSVLTIPEGITATRNLTGGRNRAQLRYNTADSSLYIWTGSQFLKVQGSGGGGVDSVTVQGDSLYYWIAGASTLITNIATAAAGGDTTIYEVVVDTTGQPNQRVLFAKDNKISSDTKLYYNETGKLSTDTLAAKVISLVNPDDINTLQGHDGRLEFKARDWGSTVRLDLEESNDVAFQAKDSINTPSNMLWQDALGRFHKAAVPGGSSLDTTNLHGRGVAYAAGDSIVLQDSSKYRVGAGLGYIPLSGTEVGKPVTGDIEMGNELGLRFLSDIDLFNHSILVGEAGPAMTYNYNSGTNSSTFYVGSDEVRIVSTNPAYKGLSGSKDFTPHIGPLDYIQKIGVDKYADSLRSELSDTAAALKGRGVAYYQLEGDSAVLTLNDSSKYRVAIGGGGGIQSIVAGSNITVDNTDPLNPVVSASGGGGVDSGAYKMYYQNRLVTIPVGSTALNYGDSYTERNGGYLDSVNARAGILSSNKGLSGSGITSATLRHFTNTTTPANSSATIMAGLNDVRILGSSNALKEKLKGGYRSIIANQFLAAGVAANSGSVATSGTWGTTVADSVISKAKLSFSGLPRVSSVAGSTLTYVTAVKGTAVVVFCFGSDPLQNDDGRFTVTVDGVLKATFDPSNKNIFKSFTENTTTRSQNAVVISGLPDTTHTIVITTLDNKTTVVDAFGTIAKTGYQPLLIGSIPKIPRNGYVNAGTAPTPDGSVVSDNTVDSANVQVLSALNEFSGFNFPIAYADINKYTNTINSWNVDSIHPTALGYGQIAQAFMDKISAGEIIRGYAEKGFPIAQKQLWGSSLDNGSLIINGTKSNTRPTSFVSIQTAGGNVGIGTGITIPAALFTIKDNSGARSLIELQGNSAGSGYISGGNGSSTVIAANRNPSTGTITNTGAATNQLILNAANGNGAFDFWTTNTNNGVPSHKVKIDVTGLNVRASGAPAAPIATLQTESFATLYRATATGLTAAATDNVIDVTATGQTITLPTAVGITGRHYTVKLTASGTGTVATTSSQTIDGSTTYSLSAQYKYVTVQSTGANWIIIANN